jgi:chemotaxis protein CheC
VIEFSELQRDALGELFNIGVGRAADSLSKIVNDEVELSAPVISLVRTAEVSSTLLGSEFRQLSTVTIDFTGPFEAQSILIFPERNALAIVSNMLDPNMTPEELSEFEQEAMCEIGNIILNACISSLADEFRVEFQGGLPVHQFSDTASMAMFGTARDQVVLVLQINLALRHEQVEGHLLFLLSVSSLQSLLDCVDRYLEQQGML